MEGLCLAELLSHSTVDFLGGLFFVFSWTEGCPVHCGMFSSIPGLTH